MNIAYDPLEGEGIERTDVYCHECSKTFIGSIDFDIDGNHIIICPNCGHEHCRVVEKGKITSERWSSKYGRVEHNVGRWTHQSLKINTSSASQFLRDKWLNMGK
jgi:DNA-directed RNA polymerase subunit RPC12/RpoP